jgi:hypothetical protein
MESFFIYAKPNIRDITKYFLFVYPTSSALSGENQFNISLFGKYFFDIRNLYISGSNDGMFTGETFFNPFSTITNLYSSNPGFNAVIVPEFNIYTDQLMSFVLPQAPKTNGFFDIIAENEAGYGKLTTGSIRTYVSSWSGFVNQQPPSISGVQVKILF